MDERDYKAMNKDAQINTVALSSDNQHIDFAMYLTGHERETIEQMYNDWKSDDTNENLPCPCCSSLDTYYTQAIHCNRCAVTTEI